MQMRLPSERIYRGKAIGTNVWICGHLHVIDTPGGGYTGYGIQEQWGRQRPYSRQVDEDTIGQCTGMPDKKGRTIFEGDIVECWSEGRQARGVVRQRIDGLWIMYPSWQEETMWGLKPDSVGRTNVEIVGNIYDDIELLEDKKNK